MPYDDGSFNRSEVAREFGVGPLQIDTWIRDGIVPAPPQRRHGRQSLYYFPQSWIEQVRDQFANKTDTELSEYTRESKTEFSRKEAASLLRITTSQLDVYIQSELLPSPPVHMDGVHRRKYFPQSWIDEARKILGER